MSSSDESLSGNVILPVTRVFTPRSLVTLLLRPRDYFANASVLRDRGGILLAALLVGIANAMDRIDQNMVKGDLRQGAERVDSFTSWAVSSWPAYWFTAFILGCISGVITWYLRGWWYRKRLEWSGAGDVIPDDARSIATLQNLVFVLPTLAWTLAQTFIYRNYIEAWEATETVALLVVVFLFWSCWTSYCAATTVYTLHKTKARVWFLILPVAFYVIVMGVFTALYAALT